VFSPLARWVKRGDRVGVIGIGGLGHLAIQFARAMGCETIAFSTSSSKRSEALEFGASDFVDTSKKEHMSKYRRKVDFMLSTVNAVLNWNQYLALLRTDGRFCLVGIPLGSVEINPSHLVLRRISICGSPIGCSEEYRRMFEFAAQHKIVAKTELFEMRDVDKALERVHSNAARFRCVLKAPATISSKL